MNDDRTDDETTDDAPLVEPEPEAEAEAELGAATTLAASAQSLNLPGEWDSVTIPRKNRPALETAPLMLVSLSSEAQPSDVSQPMMLVRPASSRPPPSFDSPAPLEAPNAEVAPFGPNLNPSAGRPPPSIFHRLESWGRNYFLASRFTFVRALWPMLAVALVLFTRWPGTNYIFDEQEALLANPYVNATNGLRFVDAIHRDFWGLPADRSVGSYRPIPNFLWRSLWHISHAPFFHHLYNVVLHAVNAALLAWIINAWTRRRGLAYLAGFVFVSCAVLTEAVSGIVGIADVLGGLGAMLALAALSLPAWAMPFGVFFALLFGLFSKESALVCVPLVPFAALLAAPLTHPSRPARAMRALLAFGAATAAFVLYVELRKRWFLSPMPSELTTPPLPGATRLQRWMFDFLVWFHQAPLPKDPLNNPLAEADTPHRIAGALRVYWRGVLQMIVPGTVSGDYSFPQEPIPEGIVFFESVAGAAMMVFPPIASVVLWIIAIEREGAARRQEMPTRERTQAKRSLLGAGAAVSLVAVAIALVDGLVLRPAGHSFSLAGVTPAFLAIPIGFAGVGLFLEGVPRLATPVNPIERTSLEPSGEGEVDEPRPYPEVAVYAPTGPVPLSRAGLVLIAIGLTWMVVSFFPHSNIPVVLPTVRAERFWYFPAIGTSLVFAALFTWVHENWRAKGVLWLGPVLVGLFLGFHGLQAYRHSMDYRNDVDFWEATKESVPNSAKAHLNYSVMKGARGDLATRLTESKIALALAPKWPMANIYTGDTLCRLHRSDEAWPYYQSGFEVGPNELSLIALALQCLHDEGKLQSHEEELRAIADKHSGSWIAYLATDTLANEEKNKGVDPKYRPRGYNEGPKDEKDDDDDDDDTPSGTASASDAVKAKQAASDDSAEPASSGEPSASATAGQSVSRPTP